MQTFNAGIQASTGTTYLSTRTSLLGRANIKTLNAVSCIGPGLTNFIDTQTNATQVPFLTYFDSANNRLYVMCTISATPTVLLYNFNASTGVNSYVGKILVSLANATATVHTLHGFKMINFNSAINVIISTTGGTLINGGTYVAANLATSDFTSSGTTIWSASGSNQKAVYFLQDVTAPGVQHAASTSWGCETGSAAATSAFQSRIYQLNNTAAAPQVYCWDLANGNLNVSGMVVNGVSAQTTLYANTSPSAFFTMSAQNSYIGTIGEPVVILNGTGNVPTAFTAWVPGSAQTAAVNTYFMRDLQQTFVFTCTALVSGISAGSTYTNNGTTFTVLNAASAAATSFTAVATPTAAYYLPLASGTLARTAGTGDASVTFSAVTAGNFFFNLSSLTAGAAITPTSSPSSFTMMRSFGASTNTFFGRTPSMAALTGTVLQNNNLTFAIPTVAPLNTALNGTDCLSFATVSDLYLGKISDLYLSQTGTTTANSTTLTVASTTGYAIGYSVIGPGIQPGTTITAIPGGTTLTLSLAAVSANASQTYTFGVNAWASLTFCNVTGTGIDITLPALAQAVYSNELDNFIYSPIATQSQLILKKLQNSGTLTAVIGGANNQYLEGNNPQYCQLGSMVFQSIECHNGWLFMCASTIGQRGIFYADLYSDTSFNFTKIISPVLQVPVGTALNSIEAIKQLASATNQVSLFIRNGASSGDAAFATATSGTWLPCPPAGDLSGTTIGPFFQLMAQYQVMDPNANCIPSQIQELRYTVTLPTALSNNWNGSVPNTSLPGASPVYYAFRLATAYTSGTVPRMKINLVDDAGGVRTYDTTTNATNFTYTTNNGSSWNALGTIPNTALTTELRFQDPSPSGNPTTAGLQEF